MRPPPKKKLKKLVVMLIRAPPAVFVASFRLQVPLDLTTLMANPKVGAIVHAGQPSVQQMGIGDVMFGVKVPAGRTIQTVYPEAYGDEVSIFDFNMRPGPSQFPRPDCSAANVKAGTCPLGTNPGRTYRFYTGRTVVP